MRRFLDICDVHVFGKHAGRVICSAIYEFRRRNILLALNVFEAHQPLSSISKRDRVLIWLRNIVLESTSCAKFTEVLIFNQCLYFFL